MSAYRCQEAEEDYYAVLGLDHDTADAKEIRKAYLRLSLRYHPDKNPGREEAAQAQFVRIGRAYQVLGDPAQRSAYDRRLHSASFRRPTSTRPSAPTAAAGNGGAAHESYSSDSPPPTHGSCHQQQQSDYYYYSYSPPAPQQQHQSQQQQYETYRQAFDATMAGLSEDELRDVVGVAATVGGILGGWLGSHLWQQHPAWRRVGALVGNVVASQAAAAAVQTAHTQSVQRAALEQDRRARLARGEALPEPPPPPPNFLVEAWHQLVQAVTGPLSQQQQGVRFETNPQSSSRHRNETL